MIYGDDFGETGSVQTTIAGSGKAEEEVGVGIKVSCDLMTSSYLSNLRQ
jgi:hypothetical protein